MNKELNIFTLRMLRDQYHAEHLDTEAEALEAAIGALEDTDSAYAEGWTAAESKYRAMMSDGDCISRQAAIDGVKTLHDVAWKNWHEPTLSANVVLDMIRELPSAQPEPQWIPCSERLPEEDGDYWVTVDPRYVPPQYKSTDIILWSNGKWMMADYFVIDGEGRKMPEYKAVEVDIPIIAWMPLPEPWRGEEHE